MKCSFDAFSRVIACVWLRRVYEGSCQTFRLKRCQSVKIGRSLARNARFEASTCVVSSFWLSFGTAVSMGEGAETYLFQGVTRSRGFPLTIQCLCSCRNITLHNPTPQSPLPTPAPVGAGLGEKGKPKAQLHREQNKIAQSRQKEPRRCTFLSARPCSTKGSHSIPSRAGLRSNIVQ